MTVIANGDSGSSCRAKINNMLLTLYNVRDYGAVGNGSADDTAAIQATVNAALAAGGGTVYFPPLASNALYYETTAAITFTGGGAGTNLITLKGEKGVDQNGSKVFGNFAGYLFDAPDTGGSNNLSNIYGLQLINQHAAGGCVRMTDVVTGEIAECSLSAGLNAIIVSPGAYNIHIRNCSIIAQTQNVGVGIYASQTIIEGCSITGWSEGVRAYNAGLQITGSRFEVNATGIVIGKNPSGGVSTISGAIISGCSTERNDTAIDIVSGAGLLIGGNVFTGTVGTGGVLPPNYGIRCRDLGNSVLSGNSISLGAAVAGIDVSACTGNNNVFIGNVVGPPNGGVAWNMPATNNTPTTFASSFTFIGSNNPTAAFPFSNLPDSTHVPRIEGMSFDITDSNTAVWGATAAGGGSNHVRVRWNGSNWTVVGA